MTIKYTYLIVTKNQSTYTDGHKRGQNFPFLGLPKYTKIYLLESMTTSQNDMFVI
jgi:hypothetical protein